MVTNIISNILGTTSNNTAEDVVNACGSEKLLKPDSLLVATLKKYSVLSQRFTMVTKLPDSSVKHFTVLN